MSQLGTFGVRLRPLVSLWDRRGLLRIGWPLWANVDNRGQGGVGVEGGWILWLPAVTFGYQWSPLVASGYLCCQVGTFGCMLGSSVVVEFNWAGF